MNSVWQQVTLSAMPLYRWRGASYLHRLVGPLQAWRKRSVLMQWADPIGAALLSTVFGLTPFVSSDLTGVLLFACGCYWALLTISDDRGFDSEQKAALGSGLTPIHLMVSLFWGVATISAAMSPVKKLAFTGWSKLTLYIVLFALAARVLRSPRLRSWLITLFLHVALLMSVYGIHQQFFGAEALATWVDPESPNADAVRVYSFLGNPNLLAGYLLPAIALSVAAIFAWRGWVAKLLAVTMTVANFMCLYYTGSRGGWIGLVVLMLTLLVLVLYWWSVGMPRFWRIWALPIAIGTVAGLFALAVITIPLLRYRVASIFAGRGDSSNNFRLNVWTSVLQMIHDYPVLGIGPGDPPFKKIYPLYQRAKFSALSAYSILLEVTVEMGMIGLFSFLWLLLVTFNQGFVQLKRLRQVSDRDGFWLIGILGALAAMFAHGCVDTVLYRPAVNTLWWLMIALIASFYAYQPTADDDSIAE